MPDNPEDDLPQSSIGAGIGGGSGSRNLYYGDTRTASDSQYLYQIREGIRELTYVVRELVAEVRKLQNGK